MQKHKLETLVAVESPEDVRKAHHLRAKLDGNDNVKFVPVLSASDSPSKPWGRKSQFIVVGLLASTATLLSLLCFHFHLLDVRWNRQRPRMLVKAEFSNLVNTQTFHALLETQSINVLSFTKEAAYFAADSAQLSNAISDATRHFDKSPPVFKVLNANLENDLKRSVAYHTKRAKNSTKKTWFSDYHPLKDVYKWYRELASEYPDYVRILPDIGTTYGGKAIMALSITNQTEALSISKNDNSKRPRFYVQAGIHAREWISVAVCQYLSKILATSAPGDEISTLLNLGEFVIVPIVNPDGYEYSWTEDRLWRKNCAPSSSYFDVFGVDLNRNFDSHWGQGGSSSYPGSDTYMGPYPASEKETKAISAFYSSLPSVVSALDLHAYSQLILRPYGYQSSSTPHERQLSAVSDAMAKMIFQKHAHRYIAERSYDLYMTTGSADDWFYEQVKEYNIDAKKIRAAGFNNLGSSKTVTSSGITRVRPYALTIELRPDEGYFGPGFELPPDEILPTSEEIVSAIIHLAKTAATDPLVV